VYEALLTANTKPADRVGIIGFGGLGHTAVMYARAMGCEVVVFSSSEDKRADAMALGATEFRILSRNGEAIDATPANINVLLIVGPVMKTLEPYSSLFAVRSSMLASNNFA
jgi:alcohol dehydrogenase (NADP+)